MDHVLQPEGEMLDRSYRLALQDMPDNDTPFAWSDGLSAAVYDDMFPDTQEGENALDKLGLHECGDSEWVRGEALSLYCQLSVDAASMEFDGGISDLVKFHNGYSAGQKILSLMEQEVQHV